MLVLRGLITTCLLASALASPHMIGAEVSGPRIERTRSLGGAGTPRDLLLLSREPGAPMVRRDGLAARTDSKTLSFEQTLEDQVIFNSTDIPLFPGPSVTVVCVKCCSKGGVEATYPGDIQDIVNPKFRVDLLDIEVYVEVDVIVSDSNQFSIPLLPFLPGLTGIELPGLKAGLFIDLLLVFQISGEADLRGGFYVKIPKGSSFEIDISEDADTTQEFTGVISKALPVTVNNDDTGLEFKAALQLKAEFGVSTTTDNNDVSILGVGGVDIPGIDLPDLGAGAIVGAFVNFVEYVANVAPEDDCALEATQELNLNLGAFAKLGVNFEEEFFGLRPSATTTLLTLPLPTACILETGLPVPTREALLPTAAECAVEATVAANDDVGENGEVIASSVDSTQAETTTAPSPTGEPPKNRHEPDVTELTAVACASQVADCPDDLLTTVTYKTTLCAAAPTKTGSCFAISDAETLGSTSVVNTKAPAPARARATANVARVDNATGTGPAATGTAVPEETTVDQDNWEEDGCGEDTTVEDSTGEVESMEEVSSDTTSASSSEYASSESPGEDNSENEATSADGPSGMTPPGLQPTASSAGLSSAASGAEPSNEPEQDSTDEPEPENAQPEGGIVQTDSGSRLTESALALAAAGLATWVLV